MPGLADLIAYTQQNARGPVYLGFEGTIAGGSYNPADGTAAMVLGETLANFDDPSQQGYQIRGKLMSPMVGALAGPQGGERAVLVPTRGGLRIFLEHDEDDSPQTPMGEWWILHPKVGTLGAGNTPVWDGGIQLTNDGPTEGDGLGGSVLGNQGAYTKAKTKSGHSVALDDTHQTIETMTAGGMTGKYDDTAKQITHTAAAGTFTQADGAAQKITQQGATGVKTIIDGAGNAISHVVTTGGFIGLGALPGAAHMFPGISTTDLSTMLGNSSTGINIQRWVDLLLTMKAMIVAMGNSGVPSLPTAAAVITEMTTLFGTPVPSIGSLPSWSSIPVPSGSAIVSLRSQ